MNKGRRNVKQRKDLRILVVDDKPIFRRGLRDMLISQYSEKVKLAEAGHGQEFVDKIESFHPRVVFVDIEMPVMNGIEATKIVKKKHPEIMVYGMSSFDDPMDIESMKKAGADGFISKSEDFIPRLKVIINEAIKNIHINFKHENLARIDKIIHELLTSCPAPNECVECPIKEIGKKTLDERFRWLQGLSKVEKLNVVLHHKRWIYKQNQYP